MKKEHEKVSLKLHIQKTKIMGSGPIALWQIVGKTMETVTEYFLCSKIIVNGNLSHEIKRYFLFGIKAMINLDSILKNRDITLPTKAYTVKDTVFLLVMY